MRLPLNLRAQNLSPESWMDQSLGIGSNDFFNESLDHFDFSLGERIENVILTVFRECAHSVKASIKNTILLLKSNAYKSLTPLEDRTGLVVFFHGLNGRPSEWDSHIEEYEKQNKKGAQLDFFAPTLPGLGHCGVEDEEVENIYYQVKAWIEKNPGKPVVLYGQSNGTRFATHLEYLLREAFPETPVYVSLTSAVLYGTSLVSKVARIIPPKILKILTFGFVNEKTCEQLSLGSDPSKKILQNARKSFEHTAERRYRMYAPLSDRFVIERGSSLPTLSENNKINEKHHFVTRCGHNSLPDVVRDKQISKTFHWMQKMAQNNFKKIDCSHCKKKGVVLKKLEECVDVEDHRTLFMKIVDCVKWVFNGIAAFFRMVVRRLKNRSFPTALEKEGNVAYPKLDLTEQKSTGLYVFVHGLKGSPTQWNRYIRRVKKMEKQATIFAPRVYKKGDISLEEATKPILEIVRQYFRECPGKPVHLFGTSNGGRIVTLMENMIDSDELGESCLRIVSVAGVLKGTKIVNALEDYHVAPLIGLNKDVQEELKWESEAAKKLTTDWNQKQKLWAREHKNVRHFYCATLEDELVRPISSSLFHSDKTASTHKVYRGETHSSIVDKSCNRVFKWLHNQILPV